MIKGKKRLPREGDCVRMKDDTDYPGEFGIILKIKKKDDYPYKIQLGDHYDPFQEGFGRSDFYLMSPCLGHPLTNIFR